MRAACAKAIDSLTKQLEIAISVEAPAEEIEAMERASLLLVLRTAYSERAAGFHERSVALVQVERSMPVRPRLGDVAQLAAQRLPCVLFGALHWPTAFR